MPCLLVRQKANVVVHKAGRHIEPFVQAPNKMEKTAVNGAERTDWQIYILNWQFLTLRV